MSISTDEVNLSLYFYTTGSIMFLLVLLAVPSINIEYVV